MKIWLVGTGKMGHAYANVLKKLQVDFVVVGRSQTGCESFSMETDLNPFAGGLNEAINNLDPPKIAINAVNQENLAETTIQLINAGTKRILLEKPGGINVTELEKIFKFSENKNVQILLAYNRRFYSSILHAEQQIRKDGGLSSIHFEFTELTHTINPDHFNSTVLRNWVLGNSSHVLDIAFFLAGLPQEWKGWSEGELDWHPKSSRFCGSGKTDQGVLFSYFADWKAPGRWGFEALTNYRRFVFRPLEKLSIWKFGNLNSEIEHIDDQLDIDFKPGIYRQTKSFIDDDTSRFCTLQQQIERARLYSKIAGYSIS